jgi:hypothetical protein
MPHRRKPEKGSFGGHFDELVTKFSEEPSSRRIEQAELKSPATEDGNVHDRLFECAWRTGRTLPDRRKDSRA